MKIEIGSIECVQLSNSSAGKERFEGKLKLADGSDVYVKVYRAVEAKVVEAKAPVVRKGGKSSEAPKADGIGALMATLSPEKAELLAKVLAQLAAGPAGK